MKLHTRVSALARCDTTTTQVFIVVRLQGYLPSPTPLPESPTQEFVITSQHKLLSLGREAFTTSLTLYLVQS